MFETAVGTVGVYICYDRHFPEGWRALGLAGAQIVFNPSATSRSLSSYLWKLEQPAAAVANEYFVAAINRVGVEEYGDNDFYGTSYFVDPRGQFVGEVASSHDEELVVRDLDLAPDRHRPAAVGVLPRPPPRRLRTAGGAVSARDEPGDLLARTRAVLPSWLALYYDEPIEIERGEGRHVWDADGNRYLDFFGGILTTMTAHALPEVTEAVAEQAGKILHTSTLYLNRPMVELAEEIAAVSGIPDAKVFFTTSGTEANDAALLLAGSLRRSNQILALRNSYHGRSFSTIAITGNRTWSPTSLSPFQTYYVHGGNRYRSPFAGLADAEFIDACVADLREVLDQAGGDVAALIAEPIQGVGGFTHGPDGLLGAFAKELARARHPVDQRRGADRLGPHRRALLGLAGARPGRRDPGHRHVRQGHRQRPVGRRGDRPRRDHGRPAGQLDLDVRRLAGHRGRGAGQPAVPARERPAGQRREGRPDPARRAAGAGLADRRRRPRQGADDRRRAGPAEHGHPPASPRPSWRAPCWRRRSGAGCWSARAGCTANVLRIAPPLSLTPQEAAEGLALLTASIEEVAAGLARRVRRGGSGLTMSRTLIRAAW